jgi:GntR family transcriptional repressor for pyruvate dehydrogenase complex
MMIRNVERTSIYEEVVKQIIYMIKSGNWKPGQMIPGEMDLSKQFNVSRNSMREALKALQLTGILESKAGKGTFLTDDCIQNINRMDLLDNLKKNSSILELFEARLIIEPQLAYFAAERANEEEIKKLRQIIEKFDKDIENNAYTIEGGYEFHKFIAGMSKNGILCNFLNSITDELKAQRFMLVHEYLNDTEILLEQGEHKMLYKAIKEGDSEQARKIMYDHINNTINIIKEQLENYKGE